MHIRIRAFLENYQRTTLRLQIFFCQIPTNRKKTGDGTQEYPRHNNNDKHLKEIADIVGKNIHAAEKLLRRSAKPPRNREKEYEHNGCRHNAIQKPLHHEWPLHIPLVGTHQPHDSDFLARCIDGKANGVKSNHNGNKREQENDSKTERFSAIYYSGQLINGNFILIIIYFINNLFTARLARITVFQKAGNRFILRCLFCPDVERCTKRILSKLLKGLQCQKIPGVPLLKLLKRRFP